MYPKPGQKIKCTITWRRSKLNGVHIGVLVGKPFRARSGAVLHPFQCFTCGKKHCIPWTSNENIIKFEVIPDNPPREDSMSDLIDYYYDKHKDEQMLKSL